MARYLWARAACVGSASFQGALHQLPGYPAVVASRRAADQVSGVLLRLRPPAAATFRHLDAYEGHYPLAPARSLFIRRRVWVRDGRGRMLRAWIYLYNWRRRGAML